MNIHPTKTREDLTMQDFKNIRRLLFNDSVYTADTMWRMHNGARTMAPIVEEAITIYLLKVVDTEAQLREVSDLLLAKYDIQPEFVEA